MELSSYEDAVFQNDEAHNKTILAVGMEGEFSDRQELFRKIGREAKMWLQHLDFIHEICE